MNVLFCTAPQGPPENTGYDHGLVALAEGLEALNAQGAQHRWSGTVAYWHREAGPTPWLIPDDGLVHWGNADIVVVSYLLWGDGHELPEELKTLRSSTKTVFLDAMDGWRGFFLDERLKSFDLVLRTHLNRRYPVPSNVKSWAFGLTNRIVEATVQARPWSERHRQVLWNFRVGHPLRDWGARSVLPGLTRRFEVNADADIAPRPGEPQYEAWAQTGRRHHSTYFARLCASSVGPAYGGYFAPGQGWSLNSFVLRILYALVQRTRWTTRTVVQYDSWRLWESLAAGALVVHVDLGRYGAELPEIPVPRVHYWPISPDTFEADLGDLLEASDETLGNIAAAGRAWALEHYRPEAQLRRLFSYLNLEE